MVNPVKIFIDAHHLKSKQTRRQQQMRNETAIHETRMAVYCERQICIGKSSSDIAQMRRKSKSFLASFLLNANLFKETISEKHSETLIKTWL